MRQLPSSSIALGEDQFSINNPIKSNTFTDMLKAQGNTYAYLSTNGSTFYMGDAETGETSYSYLNEGSAPGIQLDQWRPTIKPVRKMQDYEQVTYQASYPAASRMIDGKYYAIVSGYGINCTASFAFYPLNESSDYGRNHLSSTATNTVTLTFPQTDYAYKETWVYLDDMDGDTTSAGVNLITGYRAQMQWKVTAGTGYMKYAAIEECKKVNHSTYVNHLKLYGDELVQPYPSSTSIDTWRNDGAEIELVQSTPSKQPVMFSDPANFSYIYFDGINDELEGSADFKVGAGGMYCAMAIKPNVSSAARYLLDHQNASLYCSKIFINTNDKIRWITRHTAGLHTLDMATAVTEGSWNDVAFVVFPDPDVPGTMKKQIYLNGVLDVETTNLSAYDSTTEGPILIGNTIGNTIYYPGYMAMPVIIAIENELSGSFCERDINGLNLSWRRTWGLGQ